MNIPDDTPRWNMNGLRLTMAGLAIIADTLEKHGSVQVYGVAPDPEAPTVKALGFEIVHDREYLTEAIPLKSTRLERVGR